MTDTDEFWDFFWEERLQGMENLGKREAILAASQEVRRLSQQMSRPVRVLELGCGEAQVVGALLRAHAQLCDRRVVVGVDYNAASLARCRRDYPGLRFEEGDFTDPALLARLGSYDLVLLVNALHEVFSFTFSEELGEVDVPLAKERVANALQASAACLAEGGSLLLFDGLEPPGSPQDGITIRFADRQARADFETFACEYHPFRIQYRPGAGPLQVELSRRDFTRYIDKSIFLGKRLWQTERLESYQYFTESEFRAAFERAHLRIRQLRTLTENEDKWRSRVEIQTPAETFPQEHILILAEKLAVVY